MTTETVKIRNFEPSLGCAWCDKPFRDYTNRAVSPARFFPIFIRRNIRFQGNKYRVSGCVCGTCDQFLFEHQIDIRPAKVTT